MDTLSTTEFKRMISLMKDKDTSTNAWKAVMCVWLRERDERNAKARVEKEKKDRKYIGLAYDPSKSPHYKVIAKSSRVGDLHIYSSETGTWKASLPDCMYFNVDEERFEEFPRPPISVNKSSERSMYFGESEDHLHVTEVCPYATSFTVYEMRSDHSDWFLKYRIELDPIAKAFPKMFVSSYKKNYAVLSLIRREKFQEDSFLVLEIPGKVIRYNLVDRSSKLISDFCEILNMEYTWSPGSFRVFPYIRSVLDA
ncbi:F-box protein At5g07610-like [Apium graveolens]|uniref:F-box protein At5g07610-like n=1 Tax=Apium graveolens TaxID=4045 RepID=UPI003D7A2ACA